MTVETFKKILFVPASHKLQIDIALPESFPIREAEIILIFVPKNEVNQQKESNELLKLAGKLKSSSHFSGDPLTLQKALRNEHY
jgi:hypothetical protein